VCGWVAGVDVSSWVGDRRSHSDGWRAHRIQPFGPESTEPSGSAVAVTVVVPLVVITVGRGLRRRRMMTKAPTATTTTPTPASTNGWTDSCPTARAARARPNRTWTPHSCHGVVQDSPPTGRNPACMLPLLVVLTADTTR
jgi:hypothetical protein